MRTRRAILGAIGVAAFCALSLPIVFGEAPVTDGREGGDPWRNWIFDFQTLITGLAAVGAATWTISVMERTDRRQSERHAELVALAQRSDLRRLERAIEPQLAELKTVAHSLPVIRLDDKALETEPPNQTYELVTSIGKDYEVAVKAVRSILERPQFVDGSELFDGRLTHSLRELYDTADYLSDRLQRHNKATDWEDPNYSIRYEEEFDDSNVYFVGRLVRFRLQLKSVVTRLHETKFRHGL